MSLGTLATAGSSRAGEGSPTDGPTINSNPQINCGYQLAVRHCVIENEMGAVSLNVSSVSGASSISFLPV
jgi:hypothetical protein